MDALIRAAALSPVEREPRRLPTREEAAAARKAASAPAPVAAQPLPKAAAPLAPKPPVQVQAQVQAQQPYIPQTQPQAAALQPRPIVAAPATAPAPAPAPAPQVNVAAELEAARLRMEQELAALRADAERRGYSAGYEQGEAEARQALESQVERFRRLAAQMVQAKAIVIEDAEDAIVDLAFAALCRILGEQSATRDGVLAAVRQCAISSREREQVGVRLHPDDYALLGPASAHQMRFSPDPSIALGGCIVDSSTGTLDARLEVQLEQLRQALVAVRSARRDKQEAV